MTRICEQLRFVGTASAFLVIISTAILTAVGAVSTAAPSRHLGVTAAAASSSATSGDTNGWGSG
jgi:hypothetical protein